jgi:hypothetical protein
MKLLALIFSFTIAQDVLALDSLVNIEEEIIDRFKMGPLIRSYYVYNDIYVHINHEYPRAYKMVEGQKVELEYPLDYLKRLEKLYQLQEPLRKKKQEEADRRAREEEEQKKQEEEEKRKRFEKNKPPELAQIEEAIERYKAQESGEKKTDEPKDFGNRAIKSKAKFPIKFLSCRLQHH